MQLLLDTNGLTLKKRNNAFWVIFKKERRLISPHRITSIAVVRDCLISTAAIRMAAKHQIPIYFFNATGKAEAQLWSSSFDTIATARRNLMIFATTSQATQFVVHLFELKLQHQISNLNWLSYRKTSLTNELVTTVSILENMFKGFDKHDASPILKCRNNLMGIEGIMAKQYWQKIGLVVPSNWLYAGRTRRPAKDYFNAALNYLYGMLYNVVGQAILAAGLDPSLGILHADEYNRPTLVFDFIEPFRPWIDRLLLETMLQEKIKTTFFIQKEEGYWLSKEGRRYFIPAFNDYLAERSQFDGKRLSRKGHIFRYASLFAQRMKNYTAENR